MKSFRLSHIKHYIGCIILLLTSLGSQNGYASWTFPSDAPVPSSLLVLIPPAISYCPSNGVCVNYDGLWTEWQLPTLQVGQQASISTSSTSFAFFLGNSLNGKFGFSMTPVFQSTYPEIKGDELIAAIANRSSILSTTNAGLATFEVVSGNDYYLLFTGFVRGGQTYQLQISQVPLPAAFWMFLMGLTVLLAPKKKV